MTMIDTTRPSRLYYFAPHEQIERALTLGEFRLLPSQTLAVGDTPGFLILSLAQKMDGALFAGKSANDACLVIHDTEAFGERIHRATQRVLPNWTGIDAAVSYGAASPLGRLFSRDRSHAAESEWRFAWRPVQMHAAAHPVVIHVGDMADIAGLRAADS